MVKCKSTIMYGVAVMVTPFFITGFFICPFCSMIISPLPDWAPPKTPLRISLQSLLSVPANLPHSSIIIIPPCFILVVPCISPLTLTSAPVSTETVPCCFPKIIALAFFCISKIPCTSPIIVNVPFSMWTVPLCLS